MSWPAGNLRASQANLNRRLKAASSGILVLTSVVSEVELKTEQLEFAHSSSAADIGSLETRVDEAEAQASSFAVQIQAINDQLASTNTQIDVLQQQVLELLAEMSVSVSVSASVSVA